MVKEPYFTPATLTEKSQEFMSAILAFRRKHSRLGLRPASAGLLVLDMQNYFLDENSHAYIPSAPVIVPGLQALVESFYNADRPIIFTQHINTSENAGMMSKWWRDLITPGSPACQIIPDLDTTKGFILQKGQYDAFYGTSLEDTLRSERVEQVLIAGVMTHLCCETTGRSAFARGFEVFLAVDGTATYLEAFHRAALLNLSHGFAVPVLVAEVIARFQSPQEF